MAADTLRIKALIDFDMGSSSEGAPEGAIPLIIPLFWMPFGASLLLLLLDGESGDWLRQEPLSQ
jgi:hypothetical protein